jgi:hypothetical protein
MATTQDCVEVRYEETPRGEGAATTTPFQISTVAHFLPAQAVAMGPGPQLTSRADELGTGEDIRPQLVNAFQPAGSISVRPYADEMIWLLGLAGFQGVYTAGNGIITDPDGTIIPAGAARWVFLKRTGLVPKTAQFIRAFATLATPMFEKTIGVGISRMGGSLDGDVTADLMGLFYDETPADPNLTPAYPNPLIPHLQRGDFRLTWLGGSGAPNAFSWEITNPLERDPQLTGAASYSARSMVRGNERVGVRGTVSTLNMTKADVTSLKNAQTFAAIAKWISPFVIGATAAKYGMWIEMPSCQIVGGGGMGPLTGADRRHGGDLNYEAAQDITAGFATKITIVGAVTSVSSIGN